MALLITRIKAHPPVAHGYKRVYEQCKQCERVYYRDFVPFSLSNPILIAPCGHNVGQRWHDAMHRVEDQLGMRLMLDQMREDG